MMTIQLGSLTFSDFATSGWTFSDLIDWYGATDDKSPNNERPQGHGSFPVGRSLRSSRAISFTATYLGSSPEDAEDAADDLATIGAEGPVRMRVTTGRGSTWRDVTVATSAPEDNHDGAELVAKIDLIARDPFRYADAEFIDVSPPGAGNGPVAPYVFPLVWTGGAPGRVSLQNIGRAPSPPDFRLTGGFDSATVISLATGNRIGFSRAVPAGDFVLIDTRNRRALYNGESDVSRFLQWREWEEIPGRTTRDYVLDLVNPIGSPKLGGRVYSAWW